MGDFEGKRRPRIFNTAFESGLRSVVILTARYPQHLPLHKLVVLDHLIVHSGDIHGPLSLHPEESSRTAEIFVRRSLVSSGLNLMGTRKLIDRFATQTGFQYRAGEEAGSFVDLLKSPYTLELKTRAHWLADNVVVLSDEAFSQLVRDRMDQWASEFQADAAFRE